MNEKIFKMLLGRLDDVTEIIKILYEIKNYDEYTYHHSIGVAFYAMILGEWLNIREEGIKELIQAGLLHDFGKTRIPINIINKKARLSAEEFELIKSHPLLGYYIISKRKSFSNRVCEAVLCHHERLDKSGYPYGIDNTKISDYAKIVAIADVFDAMTSDRVYREKSEPYEVFRVFKTEGLHKFDPFMAEVFISNYYRFFNIVDNRFAVNI